MCTHMFFTPKRALADKVQCPRRPGSKPLPLDRSMHQALLLVQLKKPQGQQDNRFHSWLIKNPPTVYTNTNPEIDYIYMQLRNNVLWLIWSRGGISILLANPVNVVALTWSHACHLYPHSSHTDSVLLIIFQLGWSEHLLERLLAPFWLWKALSTECGSQSYDRWELKHMYQQVHWGSGRYQFRYMVLNTHVRTNIFDIYICWFEIC